MRPTFLNRRTAMIAAVGATLTLAACGGVGNSRKTKRTRLLSTYRSRNSGHTVSFQRAQ